MSDTRQMRQLESLCPVDAGQLYRFVEVVFGLRVPVRAVVEGNTAPFDYLVSSFLESAEGGHDLVVWANRGGGKTYLGAVATLLDMLFKPGIQVRILGGSLEQSSKMYGYLLRMLEAPIMRGLSVGVPTQRRVAIINGQNYVVGDLAFGKAVLSIDPEKVVLKGKIKNMILQLNRPFFPIAVSPGP